MIRIAALITAFTVALIAAFAGHAPAAAQDDTELRAIITGYYAAYSSDDLGVADWEMPIYSREITGLIAQWQNSLEEPVDDLNSFSWLCECQDWNADEFAATVTSLQRRAPDRATARVTVAQGWGGTVAQTLELVQENRQWRIDDIRSASFPNGLKAELIAAGPKR